MSLSPGEELFWLHCRAYGLEPQREFCFSPKRKWRLDFAWPAENLKIGVEIEGGTHTHGRHTRHAGFVADCRKYNEATRLGWRVFRYSTDMVKDGEAIDEIRGLLNA